MSQIEFYKPTIKRKDMDAVLQTMVDEKIGPGEKRQEFIDKLCQLLGLRDGMVLRSYKDAIQCAFNLAGLKTGSCLALSALAPGLYASEARIAGIDPLILDIDGENGCMSLEKLSQSGSDAAVLDEPCGSVAYQKDFKGTGIPIIEDVSQSIGSAYADEKAGMTGDIVICAMEEENLISAAGGAFVGVRSKDLSDKLKQYRDLSGRLLRYLELPDLNSSLGLVQLDNLDERLRKRKEIFKIYRQNLQKTGHKLFGLSDVDFDINGGYFAVLLNSKPQDVIKFGFRYQVPVRMAFEDTAGCTMIDDFDRIPTAIPYMLRGVVFPIYPFLSQQEIETVAKVIGHLP
ncbi:MAG: DegT/DnrJ/EryC1/StrS family aminotransferase [Sphaerochaetaceae bacterium]|jgi:perosamine synthetase|nr:DegT/DnrJ/EryC1/StrS family aminotransferase [Sphaerochaetaceae bacterium]MDD3163095.1 DegT/DnrJ/EryC1/StrS family aminotransferase [Sphaerochaetaceae bacterium]MDD4007353.1 DegT/DnrJ/EryC1/StrS family aminotransferase [Sphaerochaetaceae bacterium]